MKCLIIRTDINRLEKINVVQFSIPFTVKFKIRENIESPVFGSILLVVSQHRSQDLDANYYHNIYTRTIPRDCYKYRYKILRIFS